MQGYGEDVMICRCTLHSSALKRRLKHILEDLNNHPLENNNKLFPIIFVCMCGWKGGGGNKGGGG